MALFLFTPQGRKREKTTIDNSLSTTSVDFCFLVLRLFLGKPVLAYGEEVTQTLEGVQNLSIALGVLWVHTLRNPIIVSLRPARLRSFAALLKTRSVRCSIMPTLGAYNYYSRFS